MIGGVIGIIVTLFEILVGAIASTGSGESVQGGMLAAFAGFAFAVMGIVAGRVVESSAGWAALLLLAASIGGFIAAPLPWILAGPLFLVGAITAFVAWRRQRRSVIVAA